MISKFRPWLVASAVAAAAAGGGLALAVPASAAAASPPVPIHKVDLHGEYLRALPGARHGLIKDKTVPRTATVHVTPRTVRGTTGTCTEPNCNVSYGGGPVQHSPKVYLLLWGPNWSATGSDTHYLNAFYSGLGATGDNWSTITSQYGDASGHPSFTGSVFAGVYQDTSTPTGTGPSGSVSPTDLNAEADAFTASQSITDTADAQVVIASQSGTCFSDGWAGQPASCAYQPTQAYCAWHTNSLSAGETFTNLPYTLDAGQGCGENFVNGGSAGTYDGFSIVGGHEYAETITDPQSGSGWFDSNDNVSGGEIGDKCAWGGQLWGGSDPAGNVTLSTGSFAMQSLWSNAAGGCVMNSAPKPVGFVKATKLTSPQLVLDDRSGSHSNGAIAQVWEQAGLPGSKGVLASQTWQVNSLGGGAVSIQLKGTNLCLDVRGGGTTNGTKLQLWTCGAAGGVDQQWVPLAGGQLKAVHASSVSRKTMVMDDPNARGNGTQLQIWQSNGLREQFWTLP